MNVAGTIVALWVEYHFDGSSVLVVGNTILGKKIGQINGNGYLLKYINKVSAWIMAIYMGYQLNS